MQGRHFLSQGLGMFYVTTNGIVYGSRSHGLDPSIKKLFEQIKQYAMDDVQFNIVRNVVMRNLSIEMTDSILLARLMFS